ncbi:DUF6959 family protein [Catellatospora bangladeshensis]|nr:hypothetical protein [Catellatospora bangladeshensis]
MTVIEADLFTDAGNNAVVRLPHRAFPGILIQGDTFANLRVQLAEAASLLSESPASSDALGQLQSVINDFDEILHRYEQALASRGLRRPY